METFKNYKRYTYKGQRLAIFGKEVDGELEIFKLICNPKDKFIKNIADAVYINWGKKDNSKEWNDYLSQFHPVIEKVVIEEGDSVKYTFKKYCELYYKKYTAELKWGIKFDYLEDETQIIILTKTLKWN